MHEDLMPNVRTRVYIYSLIVIFCFLPAQNEWMQPILFIKNVLSSYYKTPLDQIFFLVSLSLLLQPNNCCQSIAPFKRRALYLFVACYGHSKPLNSSNQMTETFQLVYMNTLIQQHMIQSDDFKSNWSDMVSRDHRSLGERYNMKNMPGQRQRITLGL